MKHLMMHVGLLEIRRDMGKVLGVMGKATQDASQRSCDNGLAMNQKDVEHYHSAMAQTLKKE